MLLKDLKDEYTRRLGGTEQDVSVYFSGAGLDLLGGPAQAFGGHTISAALSAGTYVMRGPCQEEKITLQESQTDLMYACNIDALGLYNEKDWGAPIFKLLEHLNNRQATLTGANLLFRHSTADAAFHATQAAAAAAVTNASIPPIDMLRACALADTRHSSKTELLSSAVGRANSLMYIQAKTFDYSYLAFPFPTHKLVFTIFASKKQKNLQPEFEACFELLKKRLPALTSVQDLKNSDITFNSDALGNYASFAAFALHEYQRTLWAAEALGNNHTRALADFGLLLYESGKELLPLFGSGEKDLKCLFDIAAQTELAEDSRILDDGRGIFSLVNDIHIDAFTEQVKAAVTEQVGFSPVFYICAPADSSIQITT